MKYVTYRGASGPRVGRLDGSEVVDVGFDGDMVAFIATGARHSRERGVGEVPLLAPLRPRSLRDFLTFEGHLKNAYTQLGREIPAEWYAVPAYYKGLPDTVIGPGEEIPWPSYCERLDYELELAAVIGRGGRNLDASSALDSVFGFTLWNDVSARDTQVVEGAVGLGPGKAKDWDGSNVLGPCLVTVDEVDVDDVCLRVLVNGELRGADSTAHMQFTFAELVAYASRDLTLHPGEVIGSGTTAGGSLLEVGQCLQPGDLVELQADGIGSLVNRVGPRPTRHRPLWDPDTLTAARSRRHG